MRGLDVVLAFSLIALSPTLTVWWSVPDEMKVICIPTAAGVLFLLYFFISRQQPAEQTDE